ncbi:MAG: 3-deoxy-D-manno-octulosonic acid transferase [Alphaproteobacteria bacterium]|nr:3-deoxy-D-manno-octulosonic acid transferase [Alphaproteobacteria bacterium]
MDKTISLFALPCVEVFMVCLQLTAYRALWWVLTLFLPAILRSRVGAGREDARRWREKLGRGLAARPAGPLTWIHGASIGEILSALVLIDGLLAADATAEILVTTGTVTSARLVAERRPHPRLRHQFMPLDHPRVVARFLNHWRPNRVLWLESELWPNLLLGLQRRKIPVQLVNGRLSAGSLARWLRYGRNFARLLLDSFYEILPQSHLDSERFRRLGASRIGQVGNLKLLAEPLPADLSQLQSLRAELGQRPVWLAASTHPGEEVQVATAHQRLVPQFPNLVTVIVPRHPDRGPGIAAELVARFPGVAVLRRSASEPITAGIYIADSLGELGLWYRVIPMVLMGGSLVAHGGQNPLEALHFGRLVLLGPHMENFSEITAELEANQAVRRTENLDDLTRLLAAALNDPEAAAPGERGRQWLAQQRVAGQRLLQHLLSPPKGPAN